MPHREQNKLTNEDIHTFASMLTIEDIHTQIRNAS